jgi:N-acetylmuramoyl-L-alanine amidase
MSKLIAICDGHGINTPGKRTPFFPDGTFMHENDFNRAVAGIVDKHLLRCGFRTLRVAPDDTDTPLKVRTDLANNAHADFYISIHANTMGSAWGNAKGIETYHYIKISQESKRAAEIIHKHLLEGTKLLDRGVKTADFHVLRETHMPAVLVECGFMDNLIEAKLLLTQAYREECAKEIAQGICEYFGVIYVANEEGKPKLSPEDANKIIKFLSAAYDSTEDPEAKAEFKRLANELRIASGQPIQ